MRRTSFLIITAAGAAACGGYGYEARTTTITGAPMITSGPGAGEAELPRTLRSTSQSVARAVCEHEQRCGRGRRGGVSSCVDATVSKARKELSQWNCEPAAVRARLEECLAGFDEVSCDVDLETQKRPLCPGNVACGENNAKLIDPGPALAKIWE